MDGREAMALSGGAASYYIHKGGYGHGPHGGSGSGSQTAGLHVPPEFRHLSNPGIPAQANIRGGSVGSAFLVEPTTHNSNYPHNMNIGVSPGGPSSEPVKKKRGRPRKYAPDRQVSLGLSPMSANSSLTPGSNSMTPKKARGRPPGSGRKQQLALLGEWMNSSAGLAFAPHIIHIGAGEDIVEKMLSFSQQRGRAVCILSGNGSVSSVSLRQPASTGVSVTYEGHFQILCLSGSYLVAEDGGPRNRTGGVSVSLSSPDGQVVGGAAAMLIAAGLVQVVVCSFVYGGGPKVKAKQVLGPKSDESSEPQHSDDELAQPATTAPNNQTYTPSTSGVWPGSRSVDMRNHSGIDLTRG